jgi:hypothetical protein
MQIIYGGDDVVSELMYGSRSDNLIQELRNNLNFKNPLLTEQGKAYAARANQVFEQVSGWDVVRAARKAVSAISGYIRNDQITFFDTLEQIQTAPPKMQRFVMASLEIRKSYQAGLLNGYSESYVDIQPGMIGHDHYDYRVASHGIVQTTVTDEGTPQYEVTQWKMELAKWDEKLSQNNRLDLARTFSVAHAALIAMMEDPTSRYGDKL